MENETKGSDSMDLLFCILIWNDLHFGVPFSFSRQQEWKHWNARLPSKKDPTQPVKSQKLVQIEWGHSSWSEMGDSNSRPDGPKPPALPTALIPDIEFITVAKAAFQPDFMSRGFPLLVAPQRIVGFPFSTWTSSAYFRIWHGTNSAIPGYLIF